MNSLHIPDGWALAPLSDLVAAEAPIGYGIVQPGPSVSDGVPMIAIRDLLKVIPERLHRTSASIDANYKRSRVVPRDVLISVKGTTGRIGIVPDGLTANISRDVARLRFGPEQVPEFWLQLLRSERAQRTLDQARVGTTRQELSIGTLRTLEFMFPPKTEQLAIADCLADADRLIEAIDALHAKKRDLKQGMMQELLTGRTRLPGFKKPWQPAEVGVLARVTGGGTPSTRNLSYWGGDIPWFTPAEIEPAGSGLVSRSERTITADGLANSSATLLPPGSVLVTSRASIGHCAVAETPVTTNQGFASMIPRDDRSTWFLYYWTQLHKSEFESRASGSTFLEISPTKVATIPIEVPSLDEQEAIGNALSDADNEIAALERRLRSARAIKMGMMQQLLTGRTRLTVQAAA